MKHIKFDIFAACLTSIMVMSSCSDSTDDLPQVQDKNEKIKLSITTFEISPETRAVKEGTSFVKGDTIGLFVMKYNKADGWSPYTTENECFNVPAVYDGTKWNMLRDIYLTDEFAEVAAYFPYGKDYKFVNELDVSKWGGRITTDTQCDLLPQGKKGQPDVMGGWVHYMSVNANNPEAQIVFSHCLSRLTFSLLRTDNFSEGKLINATLKASEPFYKIIFIGFEYEGDYLTYNFRYPNRNDYSQQVNEISLDNPIVGNDGHLYTAKRSNIDFLMPSGTWYGLQLILKFENKEYIIDVPKLDKYFYSGNRYTFPITLHGDGN